jgi:CDP-diacylglycerol--glycerol-3-phosphate 3-phosphatidyltransferase
MRGFVTQIHMSGSQSPSHGHRCPRSHRRLRLEGRTLRRRPAGLALARPGAGDRAGDGARHRHRLDVGRARGARHRQDAQRPHRAAPRHARLLHRHRPDPARDQAPVCLGLLSFYVTYLSYRNLKGFLPFLTDQDFDPALISLDRSLFLGHDPGPLLHSLLGTGIAAHLLSSVYLFFLAFVPISLGAALIASSNPIPGLWYVTALGLNWTLGVVSYLLLPALGPVFVEPGFYANLPETGTAALQQALIYERHEALAGQAAQSIAAFASLHVSVVFTAALIAQLLHLNRFLRAALWTFLGLTFLATLYFGWHYVVDDIAGLGIGVIAVTFAGVATGHLRLQIPVDWRPAIPNALTLGRIAIIPAVVLLLLDNSGLSMTAAALFALASLTDALDGRLARRWHVTSVFGTLADPFADKLLVLGSLVSLAAVDRVPVWVVVIIASREIWATVLRSHARRHGVVIAAGPLGKAKMVFQVFTLFAVIAFDLTGAALAVPLYAMVAITIASGIEIALRARRELSAPVPARATRGVARGG